MCYISFLLFLFVDFSTNVSSLTSPGMEGKGTFGLPVVTTARGRIEFLYYPVADLTGLDNYDKVESCIREKGLLECSHLATVWLNQTIPAQ